MPTVTPNKYSTFKCDTPTRAIFRLTLIIALTEMSVAILIWIFASILDIKFSYWGWVHALLLIGIIPVMVYLFVLRKVQQSEQEWHDLIDQAADLISTYDQQGRCISVNHAVTEILGYTPEEFLRFGIRDLVHPDDLVKLSKPDEQAKYKMMMAGAIMINAQRRLRRKDGSYVVVEIHVKRLSDGRIQSIKRDVSYRQKLEEVLSISASVFDNSLEGIMITDVDNNIIDVNRAFTTITGYGREEVLGKDPKLLGMNMQNSEYYDAMWHTLKQNRSWRGEIWNRRKNGEVYAGLISISGVYDEADKVRHYVAVFSDISHFKKHESELRQIAYHDALTGLPNRVLLADRMRLAIAQANREDSLLAVCLLDLDGFKPINDKYGHEVGDQVLIEIAKRISMTIRGGDTVARLGGDEFIILLPRLEHENEMITTLERLLAVIAEPILVKQELISIEASIGVCIYQQDNVDPGDLIRQADQAMYQAKRSGKNRYCLSEGLSQ